MTKAGYSKNDCWNCLKLVNFTMQLHNIDNGNTAGKIMDQELLQSRIKSVAGKREALIQLLEQPDLGTLRIDVNQALEELDELLAEFSRTFPLPEA